MAFDFGQTEEHRMLSDSLRRLLVAEAGLDVRARRLEASPPDRMALWPALVELGVLAALASEEVGGFGGGPIDMVTVVSALSEALAVEPVLTSGVICGRLLDACGPQYRELREAVTEGEAVLALAAGEGFDPLATPSTRVLRQDGRIELEGFKPAVRHADVASHLLVSAVDADRLTLLVIQTDRPGLNRTEIRLIDGAGAADVSFSNVTIGDECIMDLSNPGQALSEVIDWGLTGLAAETAALLRKIVEDTTAYLKTRRQFGQPLAAFQALQHKLADMIIAAEEAAAAASTAAARLAGPQTDARTAAILSASLACDAAGRRCGHTAIQLFGGMGVSDETPISHYARRLAAVRVELGGEAVRADRLTRLYGHRE